MVEPVFFAEGEEDDERRGPRRGWLRDEDDDPGAKKTEG
jgi:hypothetical protein